MQTRKKQIKADLVNEVVKRLEADKKSDKIEKVLVQSVLDEFLEVMRSSLLNLNNIELRGLGSFQVKLRRGRSKARNPKTGVTVSVADHGVVTFRPGRELKQGARGIPVDKFPKEEQDALKK
jgi:integration host factor subunit beta